MTDKPAKPINKGAPNAQKRVTVTPEECFERFKSGKYETLTDLARTLRSEGHEISVSQLSRWSDKHPEWNMLKTATAANRVSRVTGLIDALHDQAHKLRADSFTGLTVRLVERLADAIPLMTVSEPSDLMTCLDAADRLKSLTHDIRGQEITNNSVGLRLMDAVTPPMVVPMAPFKKTGTNGNGSGH